MSLRTLCRVSPLQTHLIRHPASSHRQLASHFHSASILRSGFTNILADASPPPVQVSSIGSSGIQLADGLLIPSGCIFLEGKVLLWDVPHPSPDAPWTALTKEHMEVFELVVPRPEVLLIGTGQRNVQPPPFLRPYLNQLGITLDCMDTRNACATYNLLAEEGRRVAAALLPLTPHTWQKSSRSPRA